MNHEKDQELLTIRKTQFLRHVPILTHVIKEGLCSERQIVRAFDFLSFNDGEYLYRQGQNNRDVFFIDEGKVSITQRRRSRATSIVRSIGSLTLDSNIQPLVPRRNLRKRSQLEAEMEIQLYQLEQFEYCGEETFLQGMETRGLNAVAIGNVTCFLLLETAFQRLFATVHELMLYRHYLRIHGILLHHRIFHHFSIRERQYLIDHSTLEEYHDKDRIIQQAVGNVLCLVISRKIYVEASHLQGSQGLNADIEALFAMSLIEEWLLITRTRHLHLANPSVSRYLTTFVKKFKAAYLQKFEGKTLYLDLLRRLVIDPTLGNEFPFVSDRVGSDQSSSALSIIRFETRRILSLRPLDRSPFETSFLARLLESTAFVTKFERPIEIDQLTLARGIGRYATFLTIAKDTFLFRQGKFESRAFLILRGKIEIVNEECDSLQLETSSKSYDVLATLSAGDSFGELSLVTRLQRSASALAPCESDLLVFERAHLQALITLLPGVSIQHAMVKRAELLATLDFLRSSDFPQCIRLAHDIQEKMYDRRHTFLYDPIELRTLYIVKSGEVAVYLRQMVPVNDGTSQKEVLVRVATIGPREVFGVAVASATATVLDTNVLEIPRNSNTIVPSHVASCSISDLHAQEYIAATLASVTTTTIAMKPVGLDDLAQTVYMCITPVQMLELSEIGWKRLSLSSLSNIRHTLLERHRYNLETVEKQMQQGNIVYYSVEKPWQVISTIAVGKRDPKDGILEPVLITQLSRRVKDKKLQKQHQELTSLSIVAASPFKDPSQLITSPILTESRRRSLFSLSIGQNLASFSNDSPSSLSPTHTMHLNGSFKSKNSLLVISPNTSPVSNIQARSGSGHFLPSSSPSRRGSIGIASPRPRRFTSPKQDTTRSPSEVSDKDCEIMWKSPRRPSAN
ncbi:tkl protein kinase [Plasmopara halstedii]|uniref:Tkl protein kinase n=1 Tax=Plasmopara halstedii TaxID=4781 RepID=A0A0P1ANQ0_PLAHL|nr:tkl protein kinase [Plasmopara halstedii]CEG42693.1 tkl protein kinase [Plasmopara halstedii]|eukprot:XP_024579062.1 tkl protein kinase [Plasmopara halstedii]